MPGLTVTEKSHWRDRIAARIDRAIETIQGRQPALFDRIARTARLQALASLRLTESYAELEAIRTDEVTLGRRKKQAQKAMIATLRSIPLDEVGDTSSYRQTGELSLPHEAAEAINRRQAIHQHELLSDDPIGAEITRLQAEKENLLDTVWLAVSPAEIKQLWTKVTARLGDEPTPLEREALAIEPAKED